MTQLVLNNSVVLPEATRGNYSCYTEQLGQTLDMISGRRVTEYRGKVQKVSYSYDFMGNDLMRQALTVLRSGGSFPATYLPDGGDELVTSTFVCESLSNPVFAFSKNGTPYWHNFSFTLREVSPSD